MIALCTQLTPVGRTKLNIEKTFLVMGAAKTTENVVYISITTLLSMVKMFSAAVNSIIAHICFVSKNKWLRYKMKGVLTIRSFQVLRGLYSLEGNFYTFNLNLNNLPSNTKMLESK